MCASWIWCECSYRPDLTYHSFSTKTRQYAIPFLLSIYDYWRNQSTSPPPEEWELDKLPSTKFPAVVNSYKRIRFRLFQSRQKYIVASVFILIGGLAASSLSDGRKSTYICPLISGRAQLLHLLGALCPVIDTLILVGAAELSRSGKTSPEGSRKHLMLVWGYFLLVSLMHNVQVLGMTTEPSIPCRERESSGPSSASFYPMAREPSSHSYSPTTPTSIEVPSARAF